MHLQTDRSHLDCDDCEHHAQGWSKTCRDCTDTADRGGKWLPMFVQKRKDTPVESMDAPAGFDPDGFDPAEIIAKHEFAQRYFANTGVTLAEKAAITGTFTQNEPTTRVISTQELAKNSAVGVKADDGKVRLDLLPTLALAEIAKVLTLGATKYTPNNWRKGFVWSRVIASTLRHLFDWARGMDKDPETDLSHLAHAGCNILFLLTFELTKTGTDDRVREVST